MHSRAEAVTLIVLSTFALRAPVDGSASRTFESAQSAARLRGSALSAPSTFRTFRSAQSAKSASRTFRSAPSARSASRFLGSALSAPSAPPGQPAALTDAEIAAALSAVKTDPNLASERTIKTLRWNEGPARKTPPRPAWVTWIAGLFFWLEQSARVMVWTAAAVLVGLLVVYLLRIARAARAARDAEPFAAPTHVHDLDIRPETLPDDIGQAARGLWDRGDHRAALALLYRGLLSRLAHVHRLPIRESTTEGDCLVLAAAHLPQRRWEYTGDLVRLWQRAGYGGESAPTVEVYALCDGFAAALDPSRSAEAIAGGAS